MSTSERPPSPELFFATANAYQRSAALKAGVELDLFTAIAEGHTTAADLARRCDAAERGVRILCDFLVVHGMLTKDGAAYALTPDSATFLNRQSPAFIGCAVEFLLCPQIMGAFGNLTAAVRNGGTVISAEGALEPENPLWVQFAKAMGPLMRMPAAQIAKLVYNGNGGGTPMKVLDIAAGHGMFGIAVAEQNPAAEITAVDWANVLALAQENAAAAGLDGRYQIRPGDAFAVDFGTGYDVALLTNFLHHFDAPTCESLLKKIHGSLADDGRVVTLEFIPDDSRVSPPTAAAFSLVMLSSTPRGDAHTFREIEQMFHNAGFSRSELHVLQPGMEQVVVSYK